MGGTGMMLRFLCLLHALAFVVSEACWDTLPRKWTVDAIYAGYSATRYIGAGSLQINCLGGVINSAGGTPEWRVALVKVENGVLTQMEATSMINSANPYPAKIFNAPSSTTWNLTVFNLNNFRQIYVNLSMDIIESTDPLPVPAPQPVVDYDDETARVAVIYAAAAYAIPEDVLSWNVNESCRAVTKGFELDTLVDGLNYSIYTPFGYIGLDHDRQWIVVALKGTNSTSDTVTDLIQIFSGAFYYQQPCAINEHISGNTHAGFCASYAILQQHNITTRTLELMEKYPEYGVLATGHSLGGALATFFHTDLITVLQASINPHWVNRVVGYTFGQPRIGDARLAPNLPKTLFRVVHADDCIPHLCPCCANGILCLQAATCPYHISQEIWYPKTFMNSSEFYTCSETDAEDPTCSNSQGITLGVQNHLYYMGVQVGSYCYNPKAFAAYREEEMRTLRWKQSMSEDERQRRIVSLRAELVQPSTSHE
ncbi:Lipase [Diplonema papillatum]|nr:Lipase [Diplonema papillatum]